jgi:hypothetical protein
MSSAPEFLSPAELKQLTGYCYAADQERWLSDFSVPHRRDGKRVIVSRFHAREWLAGREVVTSSGPNWGALNA